MKKHQFQNYKNKILTIVQENNISQMANQLFIKPNIVLSMICKVDDGIGDAPLLYDIGKNQNIKMFELFVDCLLHFNQTYLNFDSFVEAYLNFNQCNSWIIEWNRFVKCIFAILYTRYRKRVG